MDEVTEKKLGAICEKLNELDSKRIDLEKKHGMIQYFAPVSEEGNSLKVYIPTKKAELIKLGKGDLVNIFISKKKV